MAFLLRHGRKVISCKKWLTSQPVSVCFQRQNLMHTPAAIQEPPKVLITGNNKKNLSAHWSQFKRVYQNSLLKFVWVCVIFVKPLKAGVSEEILNWL